jgi:hypothetical protein
MLGYPGISISMASQSQHVSLPNGCTDVEGVLILTDSSNPMSMYWQAYIETENIRLEREACQFWAKEIIVKIEYKYCPNLTIIDTPGLIAAAPGQKNHSLQV